jgi:hypothetical protein
MLLSIKEIKAMGNMKSKVCSLGNKLAPRMGGDRKAAFVQAWAIVKAGAVEVKAAGVSFGRRPLALSRLARYAPADVRAFIVPAPENPVDPVALKIMAGVQGGRGLYCVGYIPRQSIPLVSALRGIPAVEVIGGDIKGLRFAV